MQQDMPSRSGRTGKEIKMDIAGKKIQVLGTEYEILVETADDNSKLEDANGLCEFWSKKLIIDIAKPERTTYENLEAFNKKVLRHEIVHAFLGESGLKEYMADEVLVDWIAVQFPKMLNVFEELDIL